MSVATMSDSSIINDDIEAPLTPTTGILYPSIHKEHEIIQKITTQQTKTNCTPMLNLNRTYLSYSSCSYIMANINHPLDLRNLNGGSV